MRSDLEAMYVALTLGLKQFKRMAEEASEDAIRGDMKEAHRLVYEAAILLEKYIDPSDLSIMGQGPP